MQFAGFPQPPTEIECFSMVRGLFNSDESDIAIIDIGATSSKLYIAHKGLLMRMYRARAGGAIATKRISETLEVDFKTAEELKFVADKTVETFSDMKRAHNSSYNRVFREFNREYEEKNKVTVGTVYLAGGGALFPGTDRHLKETLNRDVVMVNPFSKVAYPAFMEDVVRDIAPSFAVALGAAMRVFE